MVQSRKRHSIDSSKLAAALVRHLTASLEGPTPLAAAHARYVGAQGHEKRTPEERSVLEYRGHKVPVVRQAMSSAWSLLHTHVPGDARPEFEFEVWRGVWSRSSVYEVRSAALEAMTSRRLRAVWLRDPRHLFEIAPEIDNWAHSDTLSTAMAEILEHDPGCFPQFCEWNTSANPWLRRQSIVGLYCYARFRKKPLPPKRALPLVEALLHDKHFYVQRGVGWTLREIDRLDSVLQRSFVERHLRRISGTAWFATSELYPSELRARLTAARRTGRKSSP
jgi:3-methyladenine DNA glycosylase AlkD